MTEGRRLVISAGWNRISGASLRTTLTESSRPSTTWSHSQSKPTAVDFKCLDRTGRIWHQELRRHVRLAEAYRPNSQLEIV